MSPEEKAIVIPPPPPLVNRAGDTPRAKVHFRPIEGFTWNPLLKFPRNAECFCGSRAKFKKCCMLKIGRACTKKEARELELAMERHLAK